MEEEKDKFIEEQDDGTKILVNSLSPDSPRDELEGVSEAEKERNTLSGYSQ